MTRELLQQALDALSAEHHFGDYDALCTALREALAAPQPEPPPEPYLCIKPACGNDCSDCNQAISPETMRNYAIGYAILRNAPLDAIKFGGVFAGRTPDNVVINGADLDAATFGAAPTAAPAPVVPTDGPADGDRVEAAIDDYIDGYVMEGDDGYYQPNDGDRAMMKDAMMGLLVDPDFLAAYEAQSAAPAVSQPTPRTADCLMCGHCAATGERVASPVVPLTDVQIDELYIQGNKYWIGKRQIARAIEKAHGVGTTGGGK